MPKERKTHQDWMRLLCGVCLRKEKNLININDDILHLIKQHHHPSYDLSLMPTVVCKSCMRPLRAKESGQKCGGNLPVAQYHLLKLPVATRRQAEDCQCSFCCICRMSLVEYSAHCKKMRAPPGRPIDYKENVEPSSSTPTPTVICRDCKGIINSMFSVAKATLHSQMFIHLSVRPLVCPLQKPLSLSKSIFQQHHHLHP